MKIAIDSNTLTYLIDATQPSYDPAIDINLADERISMLRLFLYLGQSFYILPTVRNEYNRIKDPKKHYFHKHYHDILLLDTHKNIDPSALNILKTFYNRTHTGESDCLVLAEAELSYMDILLTCDDDFIKKLSSVSSKVKIYRPKDYWKQLNIPKGSIPNLFPYHSNPLVSKTWWQWN